MKAKLTQAHGRWTSNKETKQNKSHKKRSVSASPLFLVNTIFITEESQNHIQHKQTGRNTPLLIYHRMLIFTHKNQNWCSNLKIRSIYHEIEIPRSISTKLNPQGRDSSPRSGICIFAPLPCLQEHLMIPKSRGRRSARAGQRGQGSAGGRPGARRCPGLGPPEPGACGALHRAALRGAWGGHCLKTNPKQPRPDLQPPKKSRGHAGIQTSAGLARPPVPRHTKQPPRPSPLSSEPAPLRARPAVHSRGAPALAQPAGPRHGELAGARPGGPGQRRPLTVLPL